MSEDKATLARLRRATEINWSDRKLAAMASGFEARAQSPRRPSRTRLAWVTALGTACVALVAWGVWRRHAPIVAVAPPATVAPAAHAQSMPLGPGATAVPLTSHTELALEAPEASKRRVRLGAGGSARFDVAASASAVWVSASRLQVVVLGSSVTLDASGGGDHVRVVVHDGEAEVIDASGGTTIVHAGETRTFDGAGVAPMGPSPIADHAPAPHARWRSFAARGEYDRAWQLLRTSGAASVRDEVDDLMLAADTARLAGDPARAIGYLRAVCDRHPHDARAALAAFTAGRVLLHRLDHPREAARAFARVDALDRAGALREDALAREIEAWSRAGDRAEAQRRAAAYLARYPGGRWTDAVRRAGGVE